MTETATNGIRITVLEGETASGEKTFFFPDTKDTIVFGRDPQRCDIVFAQALRERGVGSEHLALRRSLGRYRLQLNTENAVRVDGVPAFDEQEIVKQASLHLDRGALVRLEILDSRPETLVHDRPAEQVGSAVRRARSWLVPAIGAMVVVAIAVAYLVAGQRRIETQVLQAVPAEVIARTTQSVYVVLVRGQDGGESGVGTAWVGPGSRLFTNAHVAEVRSQIPPGAVMVVRRAVAPHTDHVVTSVKIHPAYKLFEKTVSAYSPAERGVAGSKRIELIPDADVATLELADRRDLGPPLPLLPEARAEGIGPGEPIAFVGFPAEGLIAGTIRSPVPISQKAQVINVTDSFLTHRTNAPNRIVMHSLPSTGGASGSPIVNTAGQVIAVLNAGNIVVVDGRRTPSAASVNFAQRVDYVYDLMDDRRLAERTAAYEKEWQAGLKRFERSDELALKTLLEDLRNEYGAKGEPVVTEVERHFTRMDPELKVPAERTPLRLEPGVHAWLVIPGAQADLDLILKAKGGRKLAEDTGPEASALVRYESLAPEDVELIAAHTAEAVDPKLRYRLRTYHWPAATLLPQTDRIVRTVKRRLRATADPSPLLARTSETTSRGPSSERGEAGFEARVPGAGHALFVAVPRDTAGVAIALKSGDDVLGRAAPTPTSPGRPVFVLAPLEGPGRDLQVVVLSPQPGASFDVFGYFWPADAIPPKPAP